MSGNPTAWFPKAETMQPITLDGAPQCTGVVYRSVHRIELRLEGCVVQTCTDHRHWNSLHGGKFPSVVQQPQSVNLSWLGYVRQIADSTSLRETSSSGDIQFRWWLWIGRFTDSCWDSSMNRDRLMTCASLEPVESTKRSGRRNGTTMLYSICVVLEANN